MQLVPPVVIVVMITLLACFNQAIALLIRSVHSSFSSSFGMHSFTPVFNVAVLEAPIIIVITSASPASADVTSASISEIVLIELLLVEVIIQAV